jgi:FkbM family methyltransferase
MNNITLILNTLHNKLKLNHGSFSEEYPEQVMAAMYIKPDDIVLELGGNIGRNSCIIASLLKDSKNLTVFESDPRTAILLNENRVLNNLNFNIEDCAISKSELYQSHWDTKPVDMLTDNEKMSWQKIKTITWDEIKGKYNVPFDTLVVDCEGALFYILKEEPDFLQHFKKIIIENDFHFLEHKTFVDKEFARYNFNRVYYKDGGFGPCYNFFYEVWEK